MGHLRIARYGRPELARRETAGRDPKIRGRNVAAVTSAFLIAGATLLGAGAAHAGPAAHHDRISLGTPSLTDGTHSAAARRNIAPSPNYFTTCATKGPNDPRCIKMVVAAIENARSHEHMSKRRLILPRNFTKLSVAKQTFVITDLERVDRGLRPYAGLSPVLNRAAHTAAVLKVDPTVVSRLLQALDVEWLGSIWAGDLGPLASDYDWMYNDGYSKTDGINIACPTRGSAGCWGHRDNILYPAKGLSTLQAGAGSAGSSGRSIAELLLGSNSTAPYYIYTWRQALAHGANGHANKR